MSSPRVFVCAGAGGVGKTTTSAALATLLARQNHKTLLVTVDPARRLAQALGVAVDGSVRPVSSPGLPEHMLFALMPDPKQSTELLIELLFRKSPEALVRFNQNRIYQALQHAMAGIHDLTSLMLIASAAEEQDYEFIVVDTAPSRFGLDFLTYPGRLAQLFEGRAIGWLGTLTDRSRRRDSEPPKAASKSERGFVAWGKKRFEAALSKILDPTTLYDLTSLFGELSLVRNRFAELARAAEQLLLGPNAKFLVVAAPSGAAEADARFVAERLRSLGLRDVPLHAHAILLNRAERRLPNWLPTLMDRADASEPMQHALRELRLELDARRRAADGIERRLEGDYPDTTILRLPTIERRDPTMIVDALAEELAPQLPKLLS